MDLNASANSNSQLAQEHCEVKKQSSKMFHKKAFLKNLQNSQENAYVGVCF